MNLRDALAVGDVSQDHIRDAADPDREDTEVFINEARARRADDKAASVVDTAFGYLAEGEVDRASETSRDRFESPCETRHPGVGDVLRPVACHPYKGSDEVIVVETDTDTAAEAGD